jgi:hypothetical protein
VAAAGRLVPGTALPEAFVTDLTTRAVRSYCAVHGLAAQAGAILQHRRRVLNRAYARDSRQRRR